MQIPRLSAPRDPRRPGEHSSDSATVGSRYPLNPPWPRLRSPPPGRYFFPRVYSLTRRFVRPLAASAPSRGPRFAITRTANPASGARTAIE